MTILHKVIHLPKTPEDLEAVSHAFAGLGRHRAFMKAAGAIDGCHVHIKPLSGPDVECYRNRKLFPSIILQAVAMLHHSPLYRSSLCPPPGHFILADRGYPCLQQPLPLITPYKKSTRCESPGLQRFNSHHSRACSIIQCAFGMIKTRFWAIFLQALEVHHIFVSHISNHSTGFFKIRKIKIRLNQTGRIFFRRYN